MTKFKGKFRKSLSWNHFAKSRLWFSAILGLGFALLFYAFLKVGFEVVRYGTFSFSYNDSVIMDPLIRRKMNIFMAAMAVLLGNSVGITYLFRRSSKSISRRIHSQILNNQALVLPAFLYVFLKCAFMTGGLFLVAVNLEFQNFFFQIMWLLIVVFYLESVKALSLYLGRQRYKVLGVHFVIVILLVGGLSYISIVDSSKMEEIYLSNNPFVEIPEVRLSATQKEFSNWSGNGEIRLKVLYNGDSAVLAFNDRKFAFNELANVLHTNDYYAFYRHRIPRIRAYVQKNIPMSEIRNFEYQLRMINMPSMIYVVDEPKKHLGYLNYGVIKPLNITKDAYELWVKNSEITILSTPPPPPPEPPFEQWNKELSSKEVISITVSDMYKANGQNSDLYFNYIQSNIGPNVVYNYTYDFTTPFEEYITVFALCQQAIYELRDQERLIKKPGSWYEFQEVRKNKYSPWSTEDRALKKKYPMHFLDNYTAV